MLMCASVCQRVVACLRTSLGRDEHVSHSNADRETAALDPIVDLPAQILRIDAFSDVTRDYRGVLRVEGAFAGLAWDDAKRRSRPRYHH
jgi:hypothetical protein